MTTTKRRMFTLLLAALALVPLAAACSSGDDDSGDSDATYMGAIVTPPIEKPDAILMDENGQPFDLRKETEGYVTLLYVGYTHCPDICPTHLYEISEALKKLDPDIRKEIKVVFATADPERDSPEQLKQYLDTFDPAFIGLTGTRDLMDQFQVALGLQPASRTDLGEGNYAVNHAAYVMAFTKDNYAYTVYPSGMGQKEWLNDLPLLVKKGFRTE
ncbi:SCO family protein [Tepidiforma sp.]|uniref:SCO family protein n=1 Tax=Tepidiforma sp. TaxID=2682230 RepID=UPI002ADD459E|nr:SCO family protein [Tepidiforma sp.]